MPVSISDLISEEWMNHVKTDFTDKKLISYYIHNNPAYIYTNAIAGGVDFAYPHDHGSIKYIENTFQELNSVIDLEFERNYSKEDSNIDIYYLGDFTEGALGLTFSESPYDGKIDIYWEKKGDYSFLKGNYGLLKDYEAYTLIHEIGHALGLSHPNNDPYGNWHNSDDTIMSYNFIHNSNNLIVNPPSWRTKDKEALQQIWGVELGNPPYDIQLKTEYFNENTGDNSIITTITSSDIDSNDSHTYELINGMGDEDNKYFQIENNKLKIINSADYEEKASYKLRIKSIDQNKNNFSKSFTLKVNDLNEAPTDFYLSKYNFDENIEAGSTVAIIYGVDEDTLDSHSFSFMSGFDQSIDNIYFMIDGNQLKIKDKPDYENQKSYTIVIKATDQLGESSEGKFYKTLYVNDLIESSNFSEIINGTSNADLINGLGGDDLIRGGEGDDTINGGSGIDTSIYTGNFNDYKFFRLNNELSIVDQRVNQNDGNDTLVNIENIQFLDQTVIESKIDKVLNYNGKFNEYTFINIEPNLYQIKNNNMYDDITGIPKIIFADKPNGISAINYVKATFDQLDGIDTYSGKIFRLYNAAFKRLPDPDGLKYWINNFNLGVDSEREIASSFINSDEFSKEYGENINDEKFVKTLYQNILKREPDLNGLNYWLGQLNSGLELRNEVLLGFSESNENKIFFSEITLFS
jgi:hypothetical protein